MDEDRELWDDFGLGTISVWGENKSKSSDSTSVDFDRDYHEPRHQFFDHVALDWGLL